MIPRFRRHRSVRVPSFDLALRLEARLRRRPRPDSRAALARWRTDQFDRRLARIDRSSRPELVLLFSDVGSATTLPLCRRLGIPTILSMVHGDVREEQRVLEMEAAVAPEFMPIYLGGGIARYRAPRLAARAPALATWRWPTVFVVPSDHIAQTSGAARDARREAACHPLRRRLPAFPAACRQGARRDPARFSSPAGSASARGSSICSKRGTGFAARAGGSSSWVRCRLDRGPLAPYLDWSSRWGGSRTPRCPRGWRRPTSSCSRRSSRARPS